MVSLARMGKWKFWIFCEPLQFQDISKQNAIIYCIFGLHNFILCREGIDEGQFLATTPYDEYEFDLTEDQNEDNKESRQIRDIIVNALWDSYLYKCQTLGLPGE